MLIRHTNRDKIRILKYCIQKTSDGRNPLVSYPLKESITQWESKTGRRKRARLFGGGYSWDLHVVLGC